jgi:UDP-N-acetylglucosamine 2-epimerase (non-hydrolysing)
MKDTIKVAVCVGTRPEAIKMAPVYLELSKDSRFNPILFSTGQHKEMLQQVFDVFEIKPDIDLQVMSPNQTLASLTSKLINDISKSFEGLELDAVLVHGDTTTCFSAGISAFYQKIKIGHVEAGLRTYDFEAPWPEEMNRRLIDPISNWCFSPTERASENLSKENIPLENIHTVGNTVIDALQFVNEKTRVNRPEIDGVDLTDLDDSRVILVTGHRRESFGKPFEEFCRALLKIVNQHPDAIIIYPVHLNPKVQEPVNRLLGKHDRIKLISPVEYMQMVTLMDLCFMIITDSGGIQEEAPSFGKPVLVTRDTTERPEAVESGAAKLVGTNAETIFIAADKLLSSDLAYQQMVVSKNPYGDGNTSQAIADILAATL